MVKSTKTTTPWTWYFYALGRRKQATATVRMFKWTWLMSVLIDENKTISLIEYFWWNAHMIENALYPLTVLWNDLKSYDLTVVFEWWWISWQAQALKLAIARSCIQLNPEYRAMLKPYWLLKRDPRRKERKKPWLRWARRAPQWSKR